MDAFSSCPCHSGALFAQCCGPLLNGQSDAATAEALMRSRYAAFCLKNADYVSQTWDSATRPARLDFDEDERVWSGLEIVSTAKGCEADDTGVVEFKARYELGEDTYLYHEISQFQKREGRWFYRDHTCPYHGKIAHRGETLKNAPCPCGSGKKYKKCCERTKK